MQSPFAPSASVPGQGTIIVSSFSPSTPLTLSSLSYSYPLKLISPTPSANAKSVLVFLLTYGGGLVAGDCVSLDVTISPASRLSLVTQGSTKIFRASRRDVVSRQILHVNIHGNGALAYLPDPIQPFGQSVYEQRQSFKVLADGSLCILDWVSEGRTARSESWDLWSWVGRNEIWAKEKLLLRDNVFLDGILDQTTDGLGVIGTLLIRGPLFQSLIAFLLREFSALPRIGARHLTSDTPRALSEDRPRAQRHIQEKKDGVVWTVTKARGCLIVKFGARKVEGGRNWLGSILRYEGTLEREFGEACLMCLK